MENEIHNFPYIKLNRNGDSCLKGFFVLFCFSHVDYIVCSPWPLTSQERKNVSGNNYFLYVDIWKAKLEF